MTVQDWWDYVKTDDPLLKVRYFLRNHGAMWDRSWPLGPALGTIMEFLKSRPELTVTQHRQYGPYDFTGTWSIVYGADHVVFRIDPDSPSASGVRRGVPSICVCN